MTVLAALGIQGGCTGGLLKAQGVLSTRLRSKAAVVGHQLSRTTFPPKALPNSAPHIFPLLALSAHPFLSHRPSRSGRLHSTTLYPCRRLSQRTMATAQRMRPGKTRQTPWTEMFPAQATQSTYRALPTAWKPLDSALPKTLTPTPTRRQGNECPLHEEAAYPRQ